LVARSRQLAILESNEMEAASAVRPRDSLRVATYNILAGGGDRWPAIREVVESLDPDVLALQEIEDPEPMEAMARALGYQPYFGPAPRFRHQGLLSRVPVARFRNHQHPEAWPRNSIEVELELGPDSRFPRLGVHTVHLTAAFQRRGRAEPDRLRELGAIREQARAKPVIPHLILGDFNSMAPGDGIHATDFLGLLSEWRRTGVLDEVGALGPVPASVRAMRWWRDPGRSAAEVSEVARAGIPRLPWLVHPLIEMVPRGEGTDALVAALMPRAAVRSMIDAGYVDCLRRVDETSESFTCPTYLPAVRIDYIFATSDLADRLVSCGVGAQDDALAAVAKLASDHFPVVADFDLSTA
jgi:endonuclease/exonuclease/phosphatase family metal-dependent hydrolase